MLNDFILLAELTTVAHLIIRLASASIVLQGKQPLKTQGSYSSSWVSCPKLGRVAIAQHFTNSVAFPNLGQLGGAVGYSLDAGEGGALHKSRKAAIAPSVFQWRPY